MQLHLLQTCRDRQVTTAEDAVQSAAAVSQGCGIVQQGMPVQGTDGQR